MGHILVVGSLAYDTVKTPTGKIEGALGGSANYFGVAASLFASVRVVGVVGEDYRAEDSELLSKKNIDISGVEHTSGKTFHWAGEYDNNLNEAKTLRTELNVFANFHPKLPESFKDSEIIFLANIDPALQLEVLNQVTRPKVIAADTMNFWIGSKMSDLLVILKRLDILLINEAEAILLTETSNAILAARKISTMGPKHIVIKRGEYGVVIFSNNRYFCLPAYPVGEVVDPTGAGDTFAGGFLGYIGKSGQPLSLDLLKSAAVYGTLLASFTVQDFSLNAIKNLTFEQVEIRRQDFRQVVSFPT